MNQSHIPGFPNTIPKVDWLTDLLIFKDEKKDNATLHLVIFHMHVHRLKVQFSDGCLMKMFMVTLEGQAWSWYEILPNGSLYSLVDFHVAFYEMTKECHSSLLLVKDCCKHCVIFIEYMENFYEDDEFVDEEILEALQDNPFHRQEERIASLLDENETQQEFIYENMLHPLSLMKICSILVSLLIIRNMRIISNNKRKY